MFNIEENTKYFLFDKDAQKVIKIFSNIYEIRDYVKGLILVHKRLEPEAFYPFGLSMSKNVNYEFSRILWSNDIIEIVSPKTRYVIFDDNFKIFNYTELVNELFAYNNNSQITFGIGRTYKGNANMSSNKYFYNSFIWRSGSKCHSRGSGAYHLKVSLAERNQTSNYTIKDAEDISDYIMEEMNIDISPVMIQKAYNSMRSKRKNETQGWFEDQYTDHHCRYGRSSSWKNNKKSKQWKRSKNIDKQTSFREYMKKYIDEEYAYNPDFEN